MTYKQVLEDEFCLKIIGRFKDLMRKSSIPDYEEEANLAIASAIFSYDENFFPKPQKFTTHLWTAFQNRLSILRRKTIKKNKMETSMENYRHDKDEEFPDLITMYNIEQAEHLDYIRNCLDRISVKARDVIQKVYFEDKTIAEASKELSCSHTTIVNRTNQAYKELRMIIERDRAEGKF